MYMKIMNCTSLPVQYLLSVLEYTGTIVVVKLGIVGASFVDAWLLILCGCIDDSLGPVI